MSNVNQKVFVSDIIGDDYQTWNNESIILDCGTGTGKTYFILQTLCRFAIAYNKKVLYLCNRKKLKEQVM